MKELNGKVFLIVDDESDFRDVVKDQLELVGAQWSEAPDGEEAFRLFESGKFDAVLSDVRMFKGGGIELLKKIREKNPTIPIFLMTGYADISTEEAKRLGASAVYAKPFDLKSLVNELQSVFKKSSS